MNISELRPGDKVLITATIYSVNIDMVSVRIPTHDDLDWTLVINPNAVHSIVERREFQKGDLIARRGVVMPRAYFEVIATHENKVWITDTVGGYDMINKADCELVRKVEDE